MTIFFYELYRVRVVVWLFVLEWVIRSFVVTMPCGKGEGLFTTHTTPFILFDLNIICVYVYHCH